jgi:hypothetical protein
MGKAIDITGQRFGRLTAVRFSHKQEPRYHYWLFKCECGQKKVIRKAHVTANKILSCGCYSQDRKDAMKIGAITRNPIYNTWEAMKARCLNNNNPAYHHYGGRGIKVCDRWIDSFPNFFEDMGQRPSNKHSLDRIDNNGNYEPSNCRWATRREQARNTRFNNLVTINSVTKCVSEWAEDLNLSPFLIFLRNYNLIG